MAIPAFVLEDIDRLELALDEGMLERLDVYLGMLLEANTRMNLTAVRDYDTAWRRLILDSLTVQPGVLAQTCDERPVRRLVDVGSGGGMPGIPLAIACPEVEVTLLEATGKKVAFHREVIEAMELSNCQSYQMRAEDAGRDPAFRGKFDVAVCRAVGQMRTILEYTLPLVRVDGRFLAMKGPSVEQELTEAGDALDILGADDVEVIEAWPESYGNDLVIVCMNKISQTPKGYPRLPGVPKQNPL